MSLETHQKEFEKAVDAYKAATEAVLSQYRNNTAEDNPMMLRGLGFSELGVRQIYTRDFKEDMNLSLHPGFDMNPLAPAPGEESIKSEKSRGEYRRYFDQFSHAKARLTQAEQLYDATIRQYRAEILAFSN
jgi:hypothetical protein